MNELTVLHVGGASEQCRALAVAMNQRFENRSLEDHKVAIQDGAMMLTPQLHAAVVTCAWALGAQQSTLDTMKREKVVPVGVADMIRNPGHRSEQQLARGKQRIAYMRAERKRRADAAKTAQGARRAICEHAKRAAANYRADPGRYHYLAGGTANLTYLTPSPAGWRSDCSQFVASVYKDCDLPSPGDVAHQWVSTWSMDRKGRVTTKPRPGDLGMYGARGNPHHVELYIGEPGCEFIGHGSPPIDSLTPGRPDYYLTYDFLD